MFFLAEKQLPSACWGPSWGHAAAMLVKKMFLEDPEVAMPASVKDIGNPKYA